MKRLSLFLGLVGIHCLTAWGQDRGPVIERDRTLQQNSRADEANRGAQRHGGPMPSVEKWRMIELAFTSSKNYDNPVMDVEMMATFVHGNTTLTRPAFWDGGASW